MQNPARGPWNLVLSVGRLVWAAKEPLKGPTVAPRFPLTELSLLEPWQCATHQPLSPPQGRLGPKCKGKAGAEVKPGSRQWRLPASHSLLLPGEGA